MKHHKYPSARGSTGSDKAIKQILKTVLETSPAANINVLFDWSQTPNMFKSGEGKAAAPGQGDKRGEKQGDESVTKAVEKAIALPGAEPHKVERLEARGFI